MTAGAGQLPGTPSDDVADILAAGRGEISTLFVSMATRHPDGADADYLRWHTLDHRPEQHRLAAVRASLRLVSTPECRAARLWTGDALDAVDHVMTYFFTHREGLDGFNGLSTALGAAGRKVPLLPPVERGVYEVQARAASPRVRVGGDVLPWFPVRGVFLVVERGTAPPPPVLDIEGVAGVWSVASLTVDARLASAGAGQTLTYVFLDGEPVEVARRLAPALTSRWTGPDVEPRFAAPLFAVVPHEWDRYVP